MSDEKKEAQPPVRAIQLKNIPGELQPLAAKIMQLEATILKEQKAASSTMGSTITELVFSPILDDLVSVKQEAVTLIQQAKTVEQTARS